MGEGQDVKERSWELEGKRGKEEKKKDTTNPMVEVVVKVELLLPDGRTSGREVERS